MTANTLWRDRNGDPVARRSPDSAWPLRNKDGLTWAELKEKRDVAPKV